MERGVIVEKNFRFLSVLLVTLLMNCLILSVAGATELRAGSKRPEIGKGPDINMPQRPQPKPAPEPPPESLPKPYPDTPPCINREPVVFVLGEGFDKYY